MATLPRFPPSASKTYSQFRPPIVCPRASNPVISSLCDNNNNKFANTLPPPNKIINTNNKSDKCIDNQIKATRKLAQQSFDSYMSKIRLIERNIANIKRRTEQRTKQTTTKTTESISSLYSEILQLNNTHNLLKRKVDTIQKSIQKNTQDGLNKATKALENDFQSFKLDFDESLSNVEALIKNLESKILLIKKDLSSLHFFQVELLDTNSKINEINVFHNCNIEKMKEIEFDLNEDMNNDQDLRIGQFQLRLENLNLRIESLQQKTQDAFNQSQMACETVQEGNFELRTKFDEQMDKIMENFKSSIKDIKQHILAMNDNKFIGIEKINEHVRKSKELLAMVQKQKIENAVNLNKTDTFSAKEEIKRIKRKVDQMEKKLIDQQNQQINQKSSNDIKSTSTDYLPKIYFNYEQYGQVKVMIVIGGDIVLY
ncbi:hypothetical protein M9Y10_023206 [Tritrichomonas musculus]|uniref:Uncharacterized protein n=1 Tax=Tritrichomonas musculus TaxID=1915356 RepID=A0ABR2KUE9_9EUKA